MRAFIKLIAFIFCFVSFTFMQTLIFSWLFFDLSSLNLFNLSIGHFISNYCSIITKAPLILIVPGLGGLCSTIIAMQNLF